MNDFWILIVIFGLGCLMGYGFGTDKAQTSINELANLKIEYNNLNATYNQLKLDYLYLEAENKALKEKQVTLEQQIASYLLEQATIDVLGIRKYQLLLDLSKIYICNKSPTFPTC